MQKLADVMDVVEDLQIQEVLVEGLKAMQEDFVCHYFVNL
jgi:hypothetical protein